VDVAPSITRLSCVYEDTRRHMLEERIYMDGLRERTKNLCQGWLSADRDLNLESLEYKAGDTT
jgi:hypothetical protein